MEREEAGAALQQVKRTPAVGERVARGLLAAEHEDGENAKAFGEGAEHEGEGQDLALSLGVAADRFDGAEADETDGEGGAENGETGGEIAGDAGGSFNLSEGEHGGWVGLVWCG